VKTRKNKSAKVVTVKVKACPESVMRSFYPGSIDKNTVCSQRSIFSQGSNIDKTKVDSNHIRWRQKKMPSLDLGGRVNVWSGFAGGNCWVVTIMADIIKS